MSLEHTTSLKVALRTGRCDATTVVDELLPELGSGPRLVRTHALEVAVEAAFDAPDRAPDVVEAFRKALTPERPPCRREVETLLPLTRVKPRALADVVLPLLEAVTDESFADRGATASSLLAAIATREPGLVQATVKALVARGRTSDRVGRECLWALACLSDTEPAVIRPFVAEHVWSLDGDPAEQVDSLAALTVLGRVAPERIPPPAIAHIASLAEDEVTAVRTWAMMTLAAIGGRPTEQLLDAVLPSTGPLPGFYTFGGLSDWEQGTSGTDSEEPLGQPAFERVEPHVESLLDAFDADDETVRVAALAAAGVLGRECPAWLRERWDVLVPRTRDESAEVRTRAILALQRSAAATPVDTLPEYLSVLEPRLRDRDPDVRARACAATVPVIRRLVVHGDRYGELAAESAFRSLVDRFEDQSTTVRTAAAEGVAAVVSEGSESLDVVTAVERVITVVEQKASGDQDIGAEASAEPLFDVLDAALPSLDREPARLQVALEAALDPDGGVDELRALQTVSESSEASGRAGVDVDATLSDLYRHARADGSDDVRQAVFQAVAACHRVDAETVGPLVDEFVTSHLVGDEGFLQEETVVDLLEGAFLAHPTLAEDARERLSGRLNQLLDQPAEDDGLDVVAVARAFSTTCVVAPPRGGAVRDQLRELLDGNDGLPDGNWASPAVEAWTAGAVLVVGRDEARAYAERRLYSLLAQHESETVGEVLGVVFASGVDVPSGLVDELARRDVGAALAALVRLPDVRPEHLPMLRQVVVDDACTTPERRRRLGELVESLAKTFPHAVDPRRVDTERLLWFGERETRSAVLSWLAETGRGTEPADDGAVAALRIHPDAAVRRLAAEAHRDGTPAATPDRTGVEGEPVTGGRSRVVNGGERSGETALETLVSAARSDHPHRAARALRDLGALVTTRPESWDDLREVVVGQSKAPHRLVRQVAATVTLDAAHAGGRVDPRYLLRRLRDDDVITNQFVRALATTDPDEWTSTELAGAVLPTALFDATTPAGRHACGGLLGELVDVDPVSVQPGVDAAVDRLADEGANQLVAYHLLRTLGMLAEEHGHLVDPHEAYLTELLKNGDPPGASGYMLLVADEHDPDAVTIETVWQAGLAAAAWGGLPAYTAVLNPPESLDITSPVRPDHVAAFCTNASSEALSEHGRTLLAELDEAQRADVTNRLLETSHSRSSSSSPKQPESPALRVRRVELLPLLATASDTERTSRRCVTQAIDALADESPERRRAGVDALSALADGGHLPADELVAHLFDHADDSDGWVRNHVAEALGASAPDSRLGSQWLLAWAETTVAGGDERRRRTAASVLGALGMADVSVRRECLLAATRAFGTDQPVLDRRLARSVNRLAEASPSLVDLVREEIVRKVETVDEWTKGALSSVLNDTGDAGTR